MALDLLILIRVLRERTCARFIYRLTRSMYLLCIENKITNGVLEVPYGIKYRVAPPFAPVKLSRQPFPPHQYRRVL
jgi:hypothetical protein